MKPRSGLEAPLDDERLARQWAAIERGERRAKLRTRAMIAIPVVAVAAIALVALYYPRPPAPQVQTDPHHRVLREGSRIALGEGADLRVIEESDARVRIALAHGRAQFDVVHRPSRAFTIDTGEVEVRVVGTVFSVARDPRVRVDVTRGAVEVRHRGIATRVAAGEHWEEPTETSAPVEPAPPTPPPAQLEEPRPHPRPQPPPPPPAGPSAQQLFDEAMSARRAGDAAQAADRFAELLRAHPDDERAALAAYELGRLRMDRLGDPTGADDALRRALASPGSAAFAEDARARRVAIRARLGDREGCLAAQAEYFEHHPTGPSADVVRGRCGAAP